MFGIDTPRQWIALAFVIIACSYALWRGRRPERIGAVVFLLNWLIHPLMVNTSAWFSPQLAAFAVDVPMFVALMWIALTSDRWWPMWATAFTFLGMLMTVIIAADPRVRPLAYMTAQVIWNYLSVVSLVIGTALEVRRHRA